MPEGSGMRDDSTPLIDATILDAMNPQRGFAHHFMERVKRPRFRFIASGLEISDFSNASVFKCQCTILCNNTPRF